MKTYYDETAGEHWASPEEEARAEAEFNQFILETAVKCSTIAIKAAIDAGFSPAYVHERVIDEMTGVEAFSQGMTAAGVDLSPNIQALLKISAEGCERAKREAK